MHINCLGEERAEATLQHDEGQDAHDNHAGDQKHGLDHLHVGRTLHATNEDVDDHEDAHDADNNGLPLELVNVQQHGNQGAGTGHLGNEVEQRHEQGRNRGRHAHRALLEAEGQHVGHGEAPDVTHRLRDEHQGDEPGNEETDRVKEAIVAVEGDSTDDAQEGRGGEVVTGNS